MEVLYWSFQPTFLYFHHLLISKLMSFVLILFLDDYIVSFILSCILRQSCLFSQDLQSVHQAYHIQSWRRLSLIRLYIIAAVGKRGGVGPPHNSSWGNSSHCNLIWLQGRYRKEMGKGDGQLCVSIWLFNNSQLLNPTFV